MLKFMLRSLLWTPIIFLGIALTLTLLPVKRESPQQGLDFTPLTGSPFSSEIAFTEENYPTRAGDALFYRQLPGPGPLTVILLHGSGSEGRYLLPLAQQVHQASGATVIVPDLRGHGRSTLGLPGDILYQGQYLDDLEDLRKSLLTHNPETNIILGGHSSGGGLAVRYGGSEKPSFEAYVLLSPYLGHTSPTTRPASGGWVQVATRRYAGLGMLNGIGVSQLNYLPVLFFNRPEVLNDTLQLTSYSYRLNQSLSPIGPGSDLSAIDKPLLVLVGSKDEAFYPDQYQPLFSRYNPGAVVDVIADASHLGLPDHPDTAVAINRWLHRFPADPSGAL